MAANWLQEGEELPVSMSQQQLQQAIEYFESMPEYIQQENDVREKLGFARFDITSAVDKTLMAITRCARGTHDHADIPRDLQFVRNYKQFWFRCDKYCTKCGILSYERQRGME